MVNCLECKGMCCREVLVEIDTPKTLDDYEDIKWYLFHKDIRIFIDADGSWNVEFPARCKHLNKQGMCDIYSKRPPVCREFSEKDCHINTSSEDTVLFRNVEQYEKWLRNNKKYQRLLKKK